MTRKKRDFSRDILPDPKFSDVMVTSVVNALMISGKKSIAEKALYIALDKASSKASKEAMEVFHAALANIRPVIEVRSRRVGGATYQVPTEVRPKRADSLAARWFVNAARTRGERTIEDRLAQELLDACDNRGLAVKKKEDTHKMADANKAFSHFKW
jgi:small subunit ribosomal protein S7